VRPLILLLLVALCSGVAIAEKRPAPAEVRVYAPTDLGPLRAELGKTVTIEGAIARAGESKSKTVRYLNFTSDAGKGVALVFFVSVAPEEFRLDALKGWIGKRVRVTGTLGEYRDSLQIKITSMNQLKEVR
jgi:DNA/RNA endonuclease YhcR with UshA esterase domain